MTNTFIVWGAGTATSEIVRSGAEGVDLEAKLEALLGPAGFPQWHGSAGRWVVLVQSCAARLELERHSDRTLWGYEWALAADERLTVSASDAADSDSDTYSIHWTGALGLITPTVKGWGAVVALIRELYPAAKVCRTGRRMLAWADRSHLAREPSHFEDNRLCVVAEIRLRTSWQASRGAQ